MTGYTCRDFSRRRYNQPCRAQDHDWRSEPQATLFHRVRQPETRRWIIRFYQSTLPIPFRCMLQIHRTRLKPLHGHWTKLRNYTSAPHVPVHSGLLRSRDYFTILLRKNGCHLMWFFGDLVAKHGGKNTPLRSDLMFLLWRVQCYIVICTLELLTFGLWCYFVCLSVTAAIGQDARYGAMFAYLEPRSTSKQNGVICEVT